MSDETYEQLEKRAVALVKAIYDRGRADEAAKTQVALRNLLSEPKKPTPAKPLKPGAPPKGRVASGKTLPRGEPDRIMEAAFRSAAPKSLSPVQAKLQAIQMGEADVPETSANRAIRRLEEKGVLERVKGTATWKYVSALRSVG